MDSTPSRRFCQKAVTFGAPGKRPLMPMTAMASGESWFSDLLIDLPPSHRQWVLATHGPSLLCGPVVDFEGRRALGLVVRQMLHQGADSRVFEHIDEGQLTVQHLPEFAMDPGEE